MSRKSFDAEKQIKEIDARIARTRNELRHSPLYSSLGLDRTESALIDRLLLRDSPARRYPNLRSTNARIAETERKLMETEQDYEKQLKRAITESKKNLKVELPEEDPFEKELKEATKLSLQPKNTTKKPFATKTTKIASNPSTPNKKPIVIPMDDEEDDLQHAIQLSLQKDKEMQELQKLLVEKQQLEQEMHERQLLRQAQDQEYEEALQLDKILEDSKREEEKRLEAEQRKFAEEELLKKMEEEEQQALAVAIEMSKTITHEQRLQRLQSTLPEEPPKQGKVAEIAIRMPDGSRYNRRFLAQNPISFLKHFVELKGLEKDPNFANFDMTVSFPKKILSNLEKTFEEEGLTPSCVINVTNL